MFVANKMGVRKELCHMTELQKMDVRNANIEMCKTEWLVLKTDLDSEIFLDEPSRNKSNRSL
jgi:hypothetical protein